MEPEQSVGGGMNNQSTGQEFKPNIYPVMYWALAYGVVAGLLLFLLSVLSQFLTLVWFPVFLAGLIWGGYRNYQKQRSEWRQNTGTPATAQSPVNEFKSAVQDIAAASRELMSQEAQETSTEEPEATSPENTA
ncbi:MAG: hypothetical protein U1C49_00585, partial [Candidatus Andersenbacteria bacterium]|nr:hypothetical protein [Candidatus Andersenbacteria bacterium]